jgi:hypothetical protein
MSTRLIAEGLSQLLPTIRLMVVDGAGHMGPLTHAPVVSMPIMRHILEAEDRCAAVTLSPADIVGAARPNRICV